MSFRLNIIVSILLFCSNGNAQQNNGKYFFETKCIKCHNNNHTINFLKKNILLNNQKMIQYVIQNKIMPPWYADTTYSRFSNEHILTQNEANSIIKWTTSAQFKTDKLNYQTTTVAKPDIILKVKQGFTIKNDLTDHFVIYKIPYEIPTDTLVSCIAFIPKNKFRPNHHLNYYIIPFEDGMNDDKQIQYVEVNKNGFDNREIYEQFGLLNINKEDPQSTYYGSWLPGMSATAYKFPFTIYLPKKGFILIKVMHYAPTAIEQMDSFNIEIYYNKTKNRNEYRPLSRFVIGTGYSEIIPPLVLEPNEVKSFFSNRVIEEDMLIYSLNPHMHKLGKSFYAYATYNKDTLPLINIPKWNFDFQENYVLNNPIYLKKNTIIHIHGVYDNTVNNKSNPYNPPQKIYGSNGMLTSEEMFLMGINYINLQKEDFQNIKYK